MQSTPQTFAIEVWGVCCGAGGGEGGREVTRAVRRRPQSLAFAEASG